MFIAFWVEQCVKHQLDDSQLHAGPGSDVDDVKQLIRCDESLDTDKCKLSASPESHINAKYEFLPIRIHRHTHTQANIQKHTYTMTSYCSLIKKLLLKKTCTSHSSSSSIFLLLSLYFSSSFHCFPSFNPHITEFSSGFILSCLEKVFTAS